MTKNNPIAKVIKNFVDKKSGKVTEARKEIQRRFFGLDWKDQKKIMLAFLKAGKADREWAYSHLLEMWDDDFTIQVLAFWVAYHEEKCAWVIIRHFSNDFIKHHVDEFKGERDYYFVCRRLAEDADFVIDRRRLSTIDYLMVLYHGNRSISDEEAKNLLFEIVHEVCSNGHPYLEVSRSYIPRRTEAMYASDFRTVSMALYYLNKMGKDEVISYFHEWECKLQTAINESMEFANISNSPLSDYEYQKQLANMVQKYLSDALPRKYKKVTK